MAEPERNHYQVLGIERTAEARAIKSAYFGLVRQFPPETHAEEFKRIRTAYEVLSDAEARKRYDAAETDFREYGDDVSEALRLCEEALRAGDEAAAQSKLRALLESRPELVIAREKLGLSYLRSKAPEQALAQFQELARLEPEESRHLLHQAVTLGRLDRHTEAESSLGQALTLKPGDLALRVALADCLIEQEKFGEALSMLDRALDERTTSQGQRLSLELRRIDVFFHKGASERGHREVKDFLGRIRAEKDPELHKYVAGQLGAIAAKEFGRSHVKAANELLAYCQELHPTASVYHPYPTTVTVDVAALPENAVQFLAEQRSGPRSAVLDDQVWGGPMLALFCSCLLMALCWWFLFDEPSRWEREQIVGVAVLLGGTICTLAFTVRSILRILRSPLRAFTTVHSLYLVRARCREVELWPLFNLTDMQVVQHHTNGAYTHSRVRLQFGEESLELSIRNRDYAVEWVKYLSGQRRRLLELLFEGFLEAEPDVDLVPHGLLRDETEAASPARKDKLLWFAGSTVATLIAVAVAILCNQRLADGVRWQAAVRDGNLNAYRSYLAENPAGGHAADAERMIGGYFDRAAAALAARIDPRVSGASGTPGVRALSEALAAIRHQPSGRLALVLELPEQLPPGFSARKGAESTQLLRDLTEQRQTALTHGLRRALMATGLGEVIEVPLPDPSSRAAEGSPAPLTLTIREAPSLEGRSFVAAGLPTILPLGSRWEVELVTTGAAQPLYRFATTTTAPPELRVARPGTHSAEDWAEAVHTRLWENSAQAFLKELYAEWGLGRSDAPGPNTYTKEEAPRLRRSPYEH